METGVQSHYREALKRAGHLAQVADHHGALTAYDEAIGLAPDRPDAHYEMGLLHHKLGRVAEAIACFERAAELAPEDATVWNNLGVLYFSQGALEKAAACLEGAIEIDPEYVDGLLNAAKVLAKLGRIDQAEDRLRRCLQIQPGSEGAMHLMQDLGIEIDRPMTTSPSPTATAKLSRLGGGERIRIRVVTHAELEKDLAKRKQWGDYWVKIELEKEFRNLGLVIDERNPDVLLYLFGVPVRGLPRNTYNIVWVYSHPDMVTPRNLREFDKIFSLSATHAEKLRAMGYADVEVMIGATSKKLLVLEKKYDVVFVGNARGPHGRKIVTDVGNVPYDFKVWGRGWDSLLPPQFYGGSYYDYEKLGELYASSLVSLNDHHPDMAREGFVAVKIFDILASGGFAISDRNAGVEEIFGDTVPQYETAEHLRGLLDRYVTHPDERRQLMDGGREIALSHTWRKRAEQIVEAIDSSRGTVTALAWRRAHAATTVRWLSPARTPATASEMRPRVLYVDTLSASHAACNVNGMMKAYRKVATLETFDYRRLAAESGPARMNQVLVETAIRFCPDLVHLGKCESVAGATVKAIKERLDTYVIHFYGDFRWDPQSWVVDIGRHVDCTLFSNTDDRILNKYRAAGVKCIGGWWDAGTDPDVFYPRNVAKTQGVVFMGNNVGVAHDGYVKRRELIEGAIERGLDVHVYGKGWEYLSNQGHSNLHLHAFVTENEFAEACSAAKITLGINGVNDVRMYASWRRAVNSMASGAFHLTHYVPDMETVFENRKHLVWFNSVPEAMELIEYYLSHEDERERIAASGRQRVLARHTWDARIAEMMGRLERHEAYEDLREFRNVTDLDIEARGSTESFRREWESTWNSAERTTPDAIRSAYNETDAYLFRGVYHNYHTQQQRFEFTAQVVRQYCGWHCHRPVKLLDYGCGAACLEKRLLGISNLQITLADVPSPGLEFARWRYRNEDRVDSIEIERQDCLDHVYDIIVCYDVLEHIPEPLAVMRHLADHHRAGGLLFLFFCTALPTDHPSGHLKGSIDQYGSVTSYVSRNYDSLGGHLYQRRNGPVESHQRSCGTEPANKGVSRSVQHESSPDDVGGSAREMRAKARVALEPRASTAARSPLRLHLGCGSVRLDGYVNIDVEDWAGACDLTADAANLHMFESSSVDHIFNHALLEHLPPWDTMKALREWCRVLRPGGTIQIEVPDLERIFQDWLVGRTLSEKEAIDNIFGGGKRPDKAYTRQDHLTGFTYDRLTRMMARCGFESFRRLEHPRYHHILVVHAKKRVA